MRSILFIVILLLTGCSTQKKCVKFIKKYPACFTAKIDTLFIQGFKLDTVYIGRNEIDTFYFDSSGVKIKTVVLWKDKLVYQNVTLKDTILISNTKYVPNERYINSKNVDQIKLFLLLIIGIVIGVLLVNNK